MKEIKLTQGLVALVDDEDYEWLTHWKWCASIHRGKPYAVRKGHPNIRMHRQIIDAPSLFQVDHIDNNGLNNQRANLRLCTNSQNHMNIPVRKGRRYIGVSFRKDRNKYEAYVKIKNKQVKLGHYLSEEDAARARDAAAIKYYGQFAKLNFK